MENHVTSKSNNSATLKIVATVAVVLAVGLGSFAGGIQYQKGKVDTPNANGMGGFNNQQGGAGGFRRNGSLGTVSAISSTSISVKDQRSGSTKTYSITSSTTITNNDATAAASDIAVGNTVMVSTASSSSTEARRIAINPSMGGGPGMGGDTQTDSSSTTTTN